MKSGEPLRVVVREPDPVAFSPFGAFLEPPDVGGRMMFGEWLDAVPGKAHRFHLNRVAPSALPTTVGQVEHHPHAAQVFLPVGVSRYLVVVMPADAAGDPDHNAAQAYLVPGTMGVAYRPGTWHAGIAVLDVEASFAVMMWRGGDDDDVFASIPELELHMPESGSLTQGEASDG